MATLAEHPLIGGLLIGGAVVFAIFVALVLVLSAVFSRLGKQTAQRLDYWGEPRDPSDSAGA